MLTEETVSEGKSRVGSPALLKSLLTSRARLTHSCGAVLVEVRAAPISALAYG